MVPRGLLFVPEHHLSFPIPAGPNDTVVTALRWSLLPERGDSERCSIMGAYHSPVDRAHIFE